jgi:hypothetical protein
MVVFYKLPSNLILAHYELQKHQKHEAPNFWSITYDFDYRI